jgi:hypothetical protein
VVDNNASLRKSFLHIFGYVLLEYSLGTNHRRVFSRMYKDGWRRTPAIARHV